jgi:cardiolipin synthase
MVLALTRAAKSGVDVRIMMPHIPDKKLIYMTTKSYFGELIAGGVKVYEYTNGFVHSKTFVADDEVASVGTANLDFRSLYMHFECGAMLYKTDSVLSVRDDFIKTLEVCREITAEDCRANVFVRIFRSILRLFAPIM